MNNSYNHVVQYYETDQMGVVHHSNYFRWMEEARVYFLKNNGYDYKKLEDDGIISPVIAIDGKYKKSAKFGDTVNIKLYISEVRGLKLKIYYEMYVENNLVFTGNSEHTFISKDMKFLNVEKTFPEFYNFLINEKELYLKELAKFSK